MTRSELDAALAKRGFDDAQRAAAFKEALGNNGFASTTPDGAFVLRSSLSAGKCGVHLRRLLQQCAEKGELVPTKTSLGQSLVQLGFDQAARRAAFVEALDPSSGYATSVGTGAAVQLKLRQPPARRA